MRRGAAPAPGRVDTWPLGGVMRVVASAAVSRITHRGYIAQWSERLTADQQVPGSNPGVPSVAALVRASARTCALEHCPAVWIPGPLTT